MKKAILHKFIIVIILALAVSGVLNYFLTSGVLVESTRQDMLYTLRLVDFNIEYDGDLQEQLDILNDITLTSDTRLTIMDRNGIVLADTSVYNLTDLENHLNRVEIEAAIRDGHGYSKRHSDTLNTMMLYVSKTSDYSDYILRLSLPYSGLPAYMRILLPMLAVSFLMALVMAVFLAYRFSDTVTKPLLEIAGEMHKLEHRNPQFQFGDYKYDELNTIAHTMTEMSDIINQTLERLEHEKNIRQEFFSNVSHELKTPITSIQGYTELLEKNIITDEVMKKDFLRRIKKEAKNMTHLINDILMISRLETNQVKVVRTQLRIKLVLDEVLETASPLAAEYVVSVNSDCRPITVYADFKHMQQLLTNLIINGIKYNNPGGRVDIIISEEDGQLVITVMDNGAGIPEESITRVFERFYRVDKGRSKKQGGTGLGLSIVKHIVQFYQGSIELESEVDKGTKIVIRLPVLEDTGEDEIQI